MINNPHIAGIIQTEERQGGFATIQSGLNHAQRTFLWFNDDNFFRGIFSEGLFSQLSKMK